MPFGSRLPDELRDALRRCRGHVAGRELDRLAMDLVALVTFGDCLLLFASRHARRPGGSEAWAARCSQ